MTRRRLFRLLALVGPVLVLFGLVEGGLRLAGFGHPSAFWSQDRMGEAVFAVDNTYFTWPFFGPRRARLATPFAVDLPKAERVTRVFVLGGSAAQGDPDPSFSTARFLEALLPAAWPENRFEVVNAAITAVDSTVVRRVAADVLALDPDVLVLYVGNNEIVGPFGPAAGGRGRRTLSAIRRGLLRFRLGQMVARMKDEVALHRGTMEEWQGLESFLGLELAPSDQALAQVRARFARNVQAIVDMAKDAGVPIVLCTIGVNLADSPPFGSGAGPDLTQDERRAQVGLIDEAMRAAVNGDFDRSLAILGDAGQIGGVQMADVEFLRGRVLLASGRQADALKAFTLSRDLDRLRFRADSSINRMIRETVSRADSNAVMLADIEGAMQAAASDGVPGRKFFYEHVHLTFEGTSVVAREIIRALAEGMPPAPLGDQPAVALPDDSAVARRLALTGWSQARMGSEILERMKRAPFTYQMGHEAAITATEVDLGMLAPFKQPEGLRRTRATLSQAVESDPDDWFHAYNLALLLRQLGDEEASIRNLRSVLEMCPTFSMARRQLGRALVQMGRPMAAATAFRRVLAVHPYSAEALTDLGVALVAADQGSQAVRPLDRALKLEPKNVTARYHLALALALQGGDGRQHAIEHLRTVLSLDPKHRDAAKVLEALETAGRDPGGR